MYFRFLGYYTQMLLIPGLCGLVAGKSSHPAMSP